MKFMQSTRIKVIFIHIYLCYLVWLTSVFSEQTLDQCNRTLTRHTCPLLYWVLCLGYIRPNSNSFYWEARKFTRLLSIKIYHSLQWYLLSLRVNNMSGINKLRILCDNFMSLENCLQDWKYWRSHAISLVERNQVIMHRLQKWSALVLRQSFPYLTRSASYFRFNIFPNFKFL